MNMLCYINVNIIIIILIIREDKFSLCECACLEKKIFKGLHQIFYVQIVKLTMPRVHVWHKLSTGELKKKLNMEL